EKSRSHHECSPDPPGGRALAIADAQNLAARCARDLLQDCGHQWKQRLQSVTRCTQQDNRQGQTLEVLLGRDTHIHCPEHVEIAIGQREQLAVLRPCPATFRHSHHVVLWAERLVQSPRQALIQQDAHSELAQNQCGGELEYTNSLLAADRREVFEEFIQRLTC